MNFDRTLNKYLTVVSFEIWKKEHILKTKRNILWIYEKKDWICNNVSIVNCLNWMLAKFKQIKPFTKFKFGVIIKSCWMIETSSVSVWMDKKIDRWGNWLIS